MAAHALSGRAWHRHMDQEVTFSVLPVTSFSCCGCSQAGVSSYLLLSPRQESLRSGAGPCPGLLVGGDAAGAALEGLPLSEAGWMANPGDDCRVGCAVLAKLLDSVHAGSHKCLGV